MVSQSTVAIWKFIEIVADVLFWFRPHYDIPVEIARAVRGGGGAEGWGVGGQSPMHACALFPSRSKMVPSKAMTRPSAAAGK